MKKLLALVLATGMTAAAFAGNSSITLTAPQIQSLKLTETVNGVSQVVTFQGTDLASLNTEIGNQFGTIQSSLNNQYFSKFHDQTDLARGFADANASAFDSATLNSFQNYDLFSIMLGTNVSSVGVSPSDLLFNQSAVTTKLDDIKNNGDSFLGVGTGGIAGQLGVNVGFLIPRLYLSAKFGFFPQVTTTGSNQVSFQQGMFGVGANYRIFDKFDVLLGLLTWRGLSLGSGVVYSSNSTDVTLSLPDQNQSFSAPVQTTSNGVTVNDTVNGSADMTNIQAKLSLDNSAIIIPVDLSTSIQAFWLLNVGLGAGADFGFSSSKIKLGASSKIGLSNVSDASGAASATIQDGSALVTASDTNGSGDYFLPRIYGSLGVNMTIFKVDVPVTYYPTTQALVLGVNVGAVW